MARAWSRDGTWPWNNERRTGKVAAKGLPINTVFTLQKTMSYNLLFLRTSRLNSGIILIFIETRCSIVIGQWFLLQVVNPESSSSITKIFQRISPRQLFAGASAPDLQFNVTCSFSTYLNESLSAIQPDAVKVTKSISASASFPLTMTMYRDNLFTDALPSAATVTCILWMLSLLE